MTIRVRFRQEGIHTKMRVFVGEPGQTFALAGTLAMRPNEAEAFFVALQAGPNGPVGSGRPVEIGVDEPFEQTCWCEENFQGEGLCPTCRCPPNPRRAGCTNESPCLQPMLRWVHSVRCCTASRR